MVPGRLSCEVQYHQAEASEMEDAIVKALACLFLLEVVVVGSAVGVQPILSASVGESCLPAEPGRDACWSELPDPAGSVGSSEIIGGLDLETEIANDFIFDMNERIVRARWWGGYW